MFLKSVAEEIAYSQITLTFLIPKVKTFNYCSKEIKISSELKLINLNPFCILQCRHILIYQEYNIYQIRIPYWKTIDIAQPLLLAVLF